MPCITLCGYGNQGRAWAHNLKDSGWKVRVCGRRSAEGGRSIARAAAEGFSVIEPGALALELKEGASQKDAERPIIALLMPDESIAAYFERFFTGPRGPASFVLAHGFAVVHGGLKFRDDDEVLLVAPKGIGTKLRENYVAGSGVFGVLGAKQDPEGRGLARARLIAEGLGLTRVGVIERSFEEETWTDLFSEQVLLTGLVPALVKESVDFLVDKGVDPKLAAYECLNELKLIVDMMVEHGIAGMYERVSTTARFGGLRAAKNLLPQPSRFQVLWEDITSGRFAAALKDEQSRGFEATREAVAGFSGMGGGA